MIRLASPMFVSITKAMSLCLGLLTVAQASAQASPRSARLLQSPQSHRLVLVSMANGEATIDTGYYYTPSRNAPSLPEGRGTSGRRGGSCIAEGATEFTALGPRSATGLTTQARPKFSWYVSPSETDLPLLFRLIEIQPDGREKQVYWHQSTAQTGFMSHQLPSDAPALDMGKEYVWQVMVRCAEGSSLSSSLTIQRVASDPELTEQLSTATTNGERAIIYGNAGLWYDAFAQVVATTAPIDGEVRTGLLRDLATVEDGEQSIKAILLAIAEETETP